MRQVFLLYLIFIFRDEPAQDTNMIYSDPSFILNGHRGLPFEVNEVKDKLYQDLILNGYGQGEKVSRYY